MESIVGKLDRLLQQYRPAYYQRLKPGATIENILEFEFHLSATLPYSFKSLYLWKNGQPSSYFEAWQSNQTLMSLAAIREAHDVLTGLLRAGEFDKANWWHPQWIPFLDNGSGDHFCIDLVGTLGGRAGQIIEFRHNNSCRKIVAPSFEAWLDSYVDLIQNEDWAYYEETGEELYLDWDPEFDRYPLYAEAADVAEQVNVLETARWELNCIHRSIGSAADYLDRGRPSPNQQTETRAAILRLEEQARDLEADFDIMLAEIREQNPAAFYRWVATHVSVLNEIVAEVRVIASPAPWDKARIHVAEKTLVEWWEVRDGTRNYVAINWHFLKDYEERMMTKLPNLILRKSA